MLRTLIAAVLLVLPACHSVPPSSPVEEADVVVRWGTSFGMCLGYCMTALSVAPGEVSVTYSSRFPEDHPPVTQPLPVSREEVEEIAALVDTALIFGLDDSYGCPDCADGGAEWVEVEGEDGKRKRVTFERGATLEPIAPLVARLRELREQLPDPPR